MRHTILILFLLFGSIGGIQAQQTKKVRGEYTYHAPENVTLEEAKRTALERAKIQLIAEEFGTVVTQTNTTFVENTDEESSVEFRSLAASDVKGEWIETIGTPEYSISYEQNMLVVKVCVEGRIREIKTAKVQFKAKVLRNGTDDRFEDYNFKNNDALYLSFTSPINGYVAVYLIDAEHNAYCALPYPNDSDGQTKVQHDKSYIFFSKEKAHPTERHITEEYKLTCDKDKEVNWLYIIFSPNPFVKVVDEQGESFRPRMTDYETFSKWLTRCRRIDKEMVVDVKEVVIKRCKEH